MRSQRFVSVALLLLASGCAGVPVFGGGGSQSPPNDDVAAEFDSLETLEATQVSTFRTDNRTDHTRATVRIDFEAPRRQYQYVQAPLERAGDRSLTNESVSLSYDASDNVVTKVPLVSAAAPVDRGQYFARIVAAAREDEQVADPSAGISPLPILPATSTAPSVPSTIEAYDVDYLGTDTVAGREAHGFEMTPASAAAVDFNRTLWLDAEYYYPLRTNQTMTLGNETYRTSTRLENATFNADLSADAFEFDPPADATVETLDFGARSFDSLSALHENVSTSVPEPDLPDGYAFQRATLFGEAADQLTLHYGGDDGKIFVTKSPVVANATRGTLAGETVSVAGHEGQYLSTGQANLVSWSCGEYQYAVVGSPLGKKALLGVAESVTCE